MAIIVEGFDNSGKSTLAYYFGLDVLHPGPRPTTHNQEHHCLVDQLSHARLPVVLDRVTCISTPAYTGKSIAGYREWALRLTETHHCILIYCRPDLEYITDFSRHKAKSYDDLKQLDWLSKNAKDIVARYDALMSTLPHMRYDWVNPDRSVVQAAYDAQFDYGAWLKCKSIMAAL
jgi:hypothetical protein